MAYSDAQRTNNSSRSVKTYSDLNLNFTRNPATGDVARLTDIEAVKRSVRNLILTNQFERPFHPEIGSSVRALLFENVTPLNAILLEDRIREVIINFEERAELTNVRVIDDADRNGYRVIINFQVLNSVENVSITEFLQRLR
jgi:phage baseplate assembly protein W